ncbi:MAG TPA: NnrU family protein [Gammaproteobacteria bacterium]|nr:NnrU family protein [Gammaproteobacteria bacterium]
MTLLIVGLVLFFAAHSVSIVAPGWRERVRERVGGNTWRAAYSIVALAGLVLIIRGYGLARTQPTILYAPPLALRHLAAALMLPFFPLLLATYLPGRIRSAVGHPMLTAVMLWAAVHLSVNGAVADVVLFGTFLVWAVADRISVQRRARRPVRGAPPSRWNDAIAVVAGLAIYAGFLLGGHLYLIGVPIIPGLP